jgi:tetratricopeptide (TPR) repeat protein
MKRDKGIFMNKKAKKAYDKAMSYYEKGKINNALELCEKALSEGLDNSVVLNFKGLLLYQKGSLNEAVTVWKINEDLNNNDIAKNYIKDVIADKRRLELYKQGEQALKQLKIDKALELFKMCAESDFNSIKVNTGIAMCYQKKGDFYEAKEYVDKALSIDENAVTAKIIKKELEENNIYLKSGDSSKSFLVGITILFIIFAITAGGYAVISKFKDKNLNKNIEETSSSKNSEEGNTNFESKELSSETSTKKIGDESNSISFDKEKVKTLMANNDLDGVYEQLKNVKKEFLSSGDSEVYNQAIDLMKNQGVSKFYEYGLWNFNQNNYSDAKKALDKAYIYCEGNSLKEHVLFYRASNSLKLSNNEGALAQYEEYYKQYPDGVYTQEALYELALLSNPVDKAKSKTYANALIKNYPNSIYVNDNIMNISKS